MSLSDEQLDAIAFDHVVDYDSIGGCLCGESYPCTTLGLVAEVRALRAERDHAIEVLRAVNDCCDHDWIEGVTELLGREGTDDA